MGVGAVPGPEQLKLVGLKLKALGAAGNLSASSDLVLASKTFGTAKTPSLRAQLLAGIRTAAKPAITAARADALSRGPKAGKLNVSVSKSQLKTTTRLTGPRYGIRITNRSKGGRGMNTGVIRHPVFPKKGSDRSTWKWVDQPYTGALGWFDKTLEHYQPEIVATVHKVCELVTIEATRRL